MRIGINLLPYTPHQHGGAEIYIRNLIRALGELELPHEYVLFVSTHAKGAYVPRTGSFTECVLPYKFDRNRLLRIGVEQFILPYFIKRSKVDCIFSNYVSPIFSPTPQIVNIHDMLYKRLPETIETLKRIYWNIMIPLSLKSSARVMTVSNSSADDIKMFFPYVNTKLFVTVEGVNYGLTDHRDVDPAMSLDFLGFSAPFVMSSATFGKHKNVETLIRAFAIVHAQMPKIRLVLTGGANTGDAAKERNRLINLVQKLGLDDVVVFTGFVSEQILASLYCAASLYVMPSLYEGFGLSVIEAQFFHTPVVCSQVPALMEVGGEAVYTVDSRSSLELSSAILALLDDEKKCNDMVEAGVKNVQRYDWRQAAKDFVYVCNTAIQNSPVS